MKIGSSVPASSNSEVHRSEKWMKPSQLSVSPNDPSHAGVTKWYTWPFLSWAFQPVGDSVQPWFESVGDRTSLI